MADESVVIEIIDKVDNSIASKIKAIATEARAGQTSLNSLQDAINKLDGTKLQSIVNNSSLASSALNKLATAQSQLATAQAKTAQATAQAQAAQSRATAAATAAQVATEKLAAAEARTAAARDAATKSALSLAAAQDRATARAKAAADAATAAAVAAAKGTSAIEKQGVAFNKSGISVKQYNAAMRGVPAQITDIVVSLQGGQRPLTVLLQQGGQLKDMFGGVLPALRALSVGLLALINPFTAVGAAIALFLFSMYKVETAMRELNGLAAQFAATGRSDIDKSFIVQLRKELMLLPDVSKAAANEIISSFAEVRNVSSTTLKAAAGVVSDLATALGTDTPKAAKTLADALKDPVKGAIDLDEKLGFLTETDFKTIKSLQDLGKTAEAQKIIIDRLSGAIGGLTNDSMTPLQKATTDLGNAWNKFTGEMANTGPIAAANAFLAKTLDGLTWILDKLSSWKMPTWLEGMFKGGLNGMVANALGMNDQKGGATGSWEQPRTRTAAQLKPTKLKTDAAGITGKKGSDKTEENRATALAKVNLQLDNQLKVMRMLGPEAEKYEMFSRIEEGLIGRKIKLNAEETQTIKDKIAAIVNGRELQQETNRIYEESVSPLRNYQTSLQAINNLLEAGTITQADANKQTLLAFQAYEKINAPLNEYHKALDDEAALRKFHGTQLEQETAQQNIINDLLTKGIVLRKDELQTLFDRIKAGRELNAIHAAENQLIADSVGKRQAEITQLTAIKNLKADPKSGFTEGDASKATADILQSSGFDTSMLQVGADAQVAVYQSMYDKIKQLREANLINAQDAAMLEAQVKIKQLDTQTAFAQSYFTGLAQLSNSSNKKLATIGKAAAISNAIIDTYKAATGAYASLASIPFVGPALGAAAAAAAIGAGMANVQAIRSQGYKEGGYTGNLPKSAVAGSVHGQEYVMDAATTSRIGVDNLDAMRRNGRLPTGGNNTAPAVNQNNNNMKIINLLDPSIVGDYLATAEGEQLIVNTMRNNRDSLNAAGAS